MTKEREKEEKKQQMKAKEEKEGVKNQEEKKATLCDLPLTQSQSLQLWI